MDARLFIVSGPSAVGKSTVVRRVLERLRGRLDVMLSVSVTTRPPRAGEVDGREYRFIDEAEFERLRGSGGLIEWARVHGHGYGTPAAPVRDALAAGRHVVLEIDVQGGIQTRAEYPDAVGIFVTAPSQEELRRRITGRGTEDPEAIERRLRAATDEQDAARRSGAYDRFIVNDTLEACVEQLVRILLEEAR
jgi:guanylate kinase